MAKGRSLLSSGGCSARQNDRRERDCSLHADASGARLSPLCARLKSISIQARRNVAEAAQLSRASAHAAVSVLASTPRRDVGQTSAGGREGRVGQMRGEQM